MESAGDCSAVRGAKMMGAGPAKSHPKQRTRYREMWVAGSGPGPRYLVAPLAFHPWIRPDAGILCVLGSHQDERNVGRPYKSGSGLEPGTP